MDTATPAPAGQRTGTPVIDRRITLTFKTPDVLADALTDHFDRLREQDAEACIEREEGYYEDERHALEQMLRRKYFPYGESVTVEVHVDEGEIDVLVVKR